MRYPSPGRTRSVRIPGPQAWRNGNSAEGLERQPKILTTRGAIATELAMSKSRHQHVEKVTAE